jgi:UPF0755 protein
MRAGPALLVLGGVASIVVFLVWSLWQVGEPWKGFPAERVVVTIEPGRPARAAAATLHAAGVINNPVIFRVLLRLRGAEEAIQAGEYEFHGASSPSQVLDRLVLGDVLKHRLTVPEGLRLQEVAALVQEQGFGRADAFLRAARGTAAIADIDPQAQDLEGYLFPDTYLFAKGVREESIVAAMVARFRAELTPARRGRIESLNLTVRQAVTLASLIEEEAGADDERPRIASVFHNRLRIGMPLQCDPTVVYALTRDGRYRGDIYRSDLRYDSPYNTYRNVGLPPGPITNPGRGSLDAALAPARTDDLYFVVNGPGRHAFSTNARDHQRAVQRYRRDRDRLEASGQAGGSGSP